MPTVARYSHLAESLPARRMCSEIRKHLLVIGEVFEMLLTRRTSARSRGGFIRHGMRLSKKEPRAWRGAYEEAHDSGEIVLSTTPLLGGPYPFYAATLQCVQRSGVAPRGPRSMATDGHMLGQRRSPGSNGGLTNSASKLDGWLEGFEWRLFEEKLFSRLA